MGKLLQIIIGNAKTSLVKKKFLFSTSNKFVCSDDRFEYADISFVGSIFKY